MTTQELLDLLPDLRRDTVPANIREAAHKKIAQMVRAHLKKVSRANVRFLDNNPDALEDLCHVFEAFAAAQEALKATPEIAEQIDLPTGPDAGAQLLVRLIAQEIIPELRHPPVPKTIPDPVEIPSITLADGTRLQIQNPFVEAELSPSSTTAAKAIHKLKETDPKLHDFLKWQAKGGLTYDEWLEHHKAIADHKAACDYSGPNPWAKKSDLDPKTRAEAMARITSEAPALAEQLKREGTRENVNPFVGEGNLTGQMKAMKDPALAWILKNAAANAKAQRQSESAYMRAKIAEMEAKLK